MKNKLQILSNFGLFMLATLVLAILQTTTWFQLFGAFPGPEMWLPAIVYLSLYRRSTFGILEIYAICITIVGLSGMHLGLLLLSSLVVFVVIKLIKSRIFWPGVRYYVLLSGVAVLSFHIAHLILSWVFENSPIHRPEISSWFLSSILTPFIAQPIYPLFMWFDKLTDREQLVESREEPLYEQFH